MAMPDTRPPPTDHGEPLSLGQQRLWFLDQFEPADAAYNMHIVQRLSGRLDLAAFGWALTELVRRHDVLRTRFPDVDGRPVAVVDPPAAVPVETVDVVGAPQPEHAAYLAVADRVNRGFDLAAGPLLRATVVRLDDEDHVLCLVQHHIVGDGWSQQVLRAELDALYRARLAGEPAPLGELTSRYADFVRWQSDRLAGPALQRAIDYWATTLADAPALTLPGDRPAPPVRSSSGDFWNRRMVGPVVDAIERFARQERATLYMTLLAAYQALLLRHTGQEDICVGSPVSGRSLVEFEPLIGFFTNTVVLRGNLSGDPSFRELVRRTRESVLDAFDHQDVPYEHLLNVLGVTRDLSRNPLFQTMFVLHSAGSAGGDQLRFGDLEVDAFEEGFQQTKFDLTLEAWRLPDRLQLTFGYSRDRFDAESIARLAHRFEVLLGAAVAEPDTPIGALLLLPEDERDTVRAWSAPAGAASGPADGTVLHAVRAQATRTPDAIAVRAGRDTLTYRDLLARAGTLAAALRARGVDRGGIVGVCLERGLDAIVALLAAWSAGAAYLALDPRYPAARLEFLLADSGATLVVSRAALAGRLPAPTPMLLLDEASDPGATVGDSGARTSTPAPGDAAYICYTSGSTGHPKGVVVPHAALAVRVAWMRSAYGLGPADRVLQHASLSFDTHAEEVYPCLSAGATLVLAPPGEPLADFLVNADAADLTVLDLPTSAWHSLLADGVAWPGPLRLMILGADQVHADAVATWYEARDVALYNTYGPTEATIIATAGPLTPADSGRPSIGTPIAHTTAYVLDGAMGLAPIGVPGHLWVGGAGLADGYLNRPALTARAFRPDPYGPPGARLYRTGDRARWRADGRLEFLGRDDDQVKVRGYRIEPGEVETWLRTHPGVADAVVTARGDELIGYVVPIEAPGPTADELRRHLAAVLPAPLVPTTFATLDAVPLTPNGKRDYRALPDPRLAPPDMSYVEPRTGIEELVARVWSEVLGVDKVGAHDDFFALGGHSLLATRVMGRLGAALELTVPVKALFLEPTVAGLADLLEAQLVEELDRLSDDEAARLANEE